MRRVEYDDRLKQNGVLMGLRGNETLNARHSASWRGRGSEPLQLSVSRMMRGQKSYSPSSFSKKVEFLKQSEAE
jgi:hypothetical protein